MTCIGVRAEVHSTSPFGQARIVGQAIVALP
ncbi:hypothetical protein MNJPNG_22385 [Cupriavidus oxalaticus]